jgi:hypothetical protein
MRNRFVIVAVPGGRREISWRSLAWIPRKNPEKTQPLNTEEMINVLNTLWSLFQGKLFLDRLRADTFAETWAHDFQRLLVKNSGCRLQTADS